MPKGVYPNRKGTGFKKGHKDLVPKASRKSASLKMKGEMNPAWKGNKVSYGGLHDWIEDNLGKPSVCSRCKTIATGHSMHWANISHKYKRELTDWIRLCVPCHSAFDRGKISL